ncbi:MAG: hypothetical protein HY301_01650 [Verrucomicrobia bacterium]|nr:hypothetical protein [Verrucomicrobiota bacterium]
MNNADNLWKKLVTAAKQTPVPDPGAPFGFSTRVVARWLAGGKPQPSVWELLSMRSLAVAVTVMLICVGVNYQVVEDQFTNDPTRAVEVVAQMAE